MVEKKELSKEAKVETGETDAQESKAEVATEKTEDQNLKEDTKVE
jgi:hypothetical protein